MSFGNLGTPTWIGPNQQQDWSYTYGDDHGLQIATAHVFTSGQTVWAIAEGERREPDGHVVYSVRFRNEGPNWALYNLQGGGVI